MLIRVWGVIASTSWVVMRSRTTRSMRDRPIRIWFWISSPTRTEAAVAEVVDVVGVVALLAGVQLHEVQDRLEHVLVGEERLVLGPAGCPCSSLCCVGEDADLGLLQAFLSGLSSSASAL